MITMKLNIKQEFISNKKSRPRIPMQPKYIVIHTTGNRSKGANARMHANYLKNVDREISWHYTVDDKEAIQHIPTDEVAWHAGDGNGKGNMQGIGIEMCVNQDGNYHATIQNTLALCHSLLTEYPNLELLKHQDCSGKYCPRELLDNYEGYDWNWFCNNFNSIKEKVKVSFNETTNSDPKQWQKDLMYNSILELKDVGLIDSIDEHIDKNPNDPVPYWLMMTLFARLFHEEEDDK